MKYESMLTTVDNPYNPFDHFDEWAQWDTSNGYHSSAFLARVVIMSDEMSEPDQALAIEYAIDEIVRENVSGMHRKITRSLPSSDV